MDIHIHVNLYCAPSRLAYNGLPLPLFIVKQSVTSEFVGPSVNGGIIWCKLGLSVIPIEFSDNQSGTRLTC